MTYDYLTDPETAKVRDAAADALKALYAHLDSPIVMPMPVLLAIYGDVGEYEPNSIDASRTRARQWKAPRYEFRKWGAGQPNCATCAGDSGVCPLTKTIGDCARTLAHPMGRRTKRLVLPHGSSAASL